MQVTGLGLAVILAGALALWAVPPTFRAVEKAAKVTAHAVVHVVTLGKK